jgi:L-ascorbate metabolism protein UlaG (beta-lactamase superfamily)
MSQADRARPRLRREAADIAEWREAPLPEGATALWWLGQAGFLLRHGPYSIVIDPYLSDHLARKYRNAHFPHRRMMDAPLAPSELSGLDFVFCTHGHSDHLDPETLPALAEASPKARFVVPRAVHNLAVKRGVPPARMRTVDADEELTLVEGQSGRPPLRLHALPAAHEGLEYTQAGESVFLGYALELGSHRVYHSGDTVPFPGLTECVKRLSPDLMLLPVNGRDEERARYGVPGNMTLAEALELTREAGSTAMVAHHIDLFRFNTIDRQEGLRELERRGRSEESLHLAETGVRYVLE